MTFGDTDLARNLFDLDRARGGVKSPDFSMIGSGCFRRAYLHEPSQIVYKVGNAWANEHEVSVAADYAGLHTIDGVKVRIPRTELLWSDGGNFSVVGQEFAADCIPTYCGTVYGEPCDHDERGMPECPEIVWNIVQRLTDCIDMHDENVLFHLLTQEFWVIDMGG